MHVTLMTHSKQKIISLTHLTIFLYVYFITNLTLIYRVVRIIKGCVMAMCIGMNHLYAMARSAEVGAASQGSERRSRAGGQERPALRQCRREGRRPPVSPDQYRLCRNALVVDVVLRHRRRAG